MKTFFPKAGELEERWFLVDAGGQTLGRLASRIAGLLRGKDTPRFTPHANMKTHVVVVNAEKVRLTGRKLDEKVYYRHSNWPGGLRAVTARAQLQKKPAEVLRSAVRGMLPHNRLGDATMKRLLLYAGPEHKHSAQKPVAVTLTKTKAAATTAQA